MNKFLCFTRANILLFIHLVKDKVPIEGYKHIVKFPDDGHPTCCAEAVNLYGDARDEIVTWDYNQMYIYTQDDAPKENVYTPYKYPDYNASNYRGEYSYREKFW